jgi:hypothetical protein
MAWAKEGYETPSDQNQCINDLKTRILYTVGKNLQFLSLNR